MLCAIKDFDDCKKRRMRQNLVHAAGKSRRKENKKGRRVGRVISLERFYSEAALGADSAPVTADAVCFAFSFLSRSSRAIISCTSCTTLASSLTRNKGSSSNSSNNQTAKTSS